MTAEHPPRLDADRLRRVVLVVALINFAYFFVEFTVALLAGSVSLLADSVDFLEDAAINLLVFLAFGWSLRARSAVGKLMVLVLLVLSLLLFFWLRSLPGGAVGALLGDRGTPEARAALEAQLGLDQPLPMQYVAFVQRCLSGDFGVSTALLPGTPGLTVDPDGTVRWHLDMASTEYARTLALERSTTKTAGEEPHSK